MSATSRSTATQLGVVVVAEPVAVGHLVDAVVVGVDEGLAGPQEAPDLDGQRRRDPVAVQRRVPEVGGGEAGAPELVLGHHRHRAGRARRTGRGAGSCRPAPSAGRRVSARCPSVHRSTLRISVAEGQPVAEEPVVAGGRPVVIEVRAQAVVVGATEVMARSMPSAADRVGARAARARSCSQPSPSRTSRTTWRACSAASGQPVGTGVGRVAGPVSRAGAPRWRCTRPGSRGGRGRVPRRSVGGRCGGGVGHSCRL